MEQGVKLSHKKRSLRAKILRREEKLECKCMLWLWDLRMRAPTPTEVVVVWKRKHSRVKTAEPKSVGSESFRVSWPEELELDITLECCHDLILRAPSTIRVFDLKTKKVLAEGVMDLSEIFVDMLDQPEAVVEVPLRKCLDPFAVLRLRVTFVVPQHIELELHCNDGQLPETDAYGRNDRRTKSLFRAFAPQNAKRATAAPPDIGKSGPTNLSLPYIPLLAVPSVDDKTPAERSDRSSPCRFGQSTPRSPCKLKRAFSGAKGQKFADSEINHIATVHTPDPTMSLSASMKSIGTNLSKDLSSCERRQGKV